MPGIDSKILLMTPFVHGAGILAMAMHDRGGSAVLLDGVHPPTVLGLLDRGDIDFVFAPPTVLAKLCGALEDRSIAGIKTIFTGTAPLLPSLYAKARKIFGPIIRVTYGKSEINNPIAALSPAETDAYYAEAERGDGVCVGYAGTGVEIQIRDEDGAVLPQGEVGEVHLRGRHMSCGHIDGAGFHPLPPDGFHATGDLGRIDARTRLHLVGRLADVIKSGGYKVHPDEIERALAPTAPHVAVLSLPSEYWGEIIVAVAETGDGAWPDRARAALGDLARHKHPRAFLCMDELPRNAQGKVMRRLIRDWVLETHTLTDGPYPKLDRR
jgi:acyl-CoA synthetase (AMP-forming)/AMP-acid ligase II